MTFDDKLRLHYQLLSHTFVNMHTFEVPYKFMIHAS